MHTFFANSLQIIWRLKNFFVSLCKQKGERVAPIERPKNKKSRSERHGIMEKYTQKQLKELVKSGAAVDVTNAMSTAEAVPEDYKKIGYSLGVYGKNGLLLQGCESGKLYAVTARSSAIFMF